MTGSIAGSVFGIKSVVVKSKGDEGLGPEMFSKQKENFIDLDLKDKWSTK